MPHILHVLSHDLPTGTAKQVDLLVHRLATDVWQHSVYSLERNANRREQFHARLAARTTFRGSSGTFDPTILPSLRRMLTDTRPDAVHAWGPSAVAIAQACFWLRRTMAHDFSIVVSIRSHHQAEQLRRLPYRWLPSVVDRFVVNSDALVQEMSSTSRVTMIPNGACGSSENGEATGAAVSQSAAPGLELRRELGLADDVRLVVAVGDLRTKKRLKDLIWGLDLLRVIHPEVHLVIVGSGPTMDRLRQFDRDVNLDDCVHFLGQRSDLSDLLPQCFCLWQASEDEGCSNAILDAMVAGIPVIASDIRGHEDMIADGETGILVPLGDCAEFARKTNILLQNSDLADRIASHARAHVQTAFSTDAMLDAYRELYVQLGSNMVGNPS